MDRSYDSYFKEQRKYNLWSKLYEDNSVDVIFDQTQINCEG